MKWKWTWTSTTTSAPAFRHLFASDGWHPVESVQVDVNTNGEVTYECSVDVSGAEIILYDNSLGADSDDGTGGTTPLGGGSITVHAVKKK